LLTGWESFIKLNSKESSKAHATLRPPLKWAGGKRWLVPHLLDIWDEHRHRRFVEPFCGGLSIPLALQPERALLNDINPASNQFLFAAQAWLASDNGDA